MKRPYTMMLEDEEAVSIRALLKDQVKAETVYIDIATKRLDTTPSMQPIIDYSEKQRQLFSDAYEMLRRSDDERIQKL